MVREVERVNPSMAQTGAEVGEEGTDSMAQGHTTRWTPEPTPSVLAQLSPDRLDGRGQGSLG